MGWGDLMRGHEHLIRARLAGAPVTVVDLDVGVGGAPDFWRRGKGWHFRIALDLDEAGTADLRCCHRLPVFVHADSYAEGWPAFERAMDFEPIAVHLCAPEIVLRFTGEEIEQLWAK